MPDGQPPPVHPAPILRAERIYLRPAERSDLPLFVSWLADAETKRHLSLRSPLSLAMEEKWFEQVVEHQGRDRYHFVICLIDDGRPIGVADLVKGDLGLDMQVLWRRAAAGEAGGERHRVAGGVGSGQQLLGRGAPFRFFGA